MLALALEYFRDFSEVFWCVCWMVRASHGGVCGFIWEIILLHLHFGDFQYFRVLQHFCERGFSCSEVDEHLLPDVRCEAVVQFSSDVTLTDMVADHTDPLSVGVVGYAFVATDCMRVERSSYVSLS